MPHSIAAKTSPGRFFEDFSLGEVIAPRDAAHGDERRRRALHGAVRHRASPCSRPTPSRAASAIRHAPVDDLLVFHIVFGKTVPDISLNAVANLGYAAGRFLAPVYPGDTLRTVSEVIGLKENSNRQTGVVYVRSTGRNQHGDEVLDYVRWVMVRKRDPDARDRGGARADRCPARSSRTRSATPAPYSTSTPTTRAWPAVRTAGATTTIGERIDHVDGMTVEEAEHQLATRLYQNTAKVHFDQLAQSASRFGKRLIYGGHVISLARALSFNGLGNAFHVAAINGGRHVAPLFAGGTVYAWSEVLDKRRCRGATTSGALRVRMVATQDRPCADFPLKAGEEL